MFADAWTDLDVKGKRNSLCNTGSCEFLLTCWMASGHVDSTCGGFLYVCCDRNSAKTNENIAINTNTGSASDEYGPVTNDPSKSPPVRGIIDFCTHLLLCSVYTHNIITVIYVGLVTLHRFNDITRCVTYCRTPCVLFLPGRSL